MEPSSYAAAGLRVRRRRHKVIMALGTGPPDRATRRVGTGRLHGYTAPPPNGDQRKQHKLMRAVHLSWFISTMLEARGARVVAYWPATAWLKPE